MKNKVKPSVSGTVLALTTSSIITGGVAMLITVLDPVITISATGYTFKNLFIAQNMDIL